MFQQEKEMKTFSFLSNKSLDYLEDVVSGTTSITEGYTN